jgi:hypothetical protein
MKKIYLFAAFGLMAIGAQAQSTAATGDAYMAGQLATEDLNGTARYVGMGGAMDALGADLSVMSTNPAGIGLYRSSQVAGSFGLNSQEDGKSFADGSKTNASFDQAGFVIATRTGQQSYVNVGFNFHKSRNFDYVLSAANKLHGSSQANQTVYKDMNTQGGIFEYDNGRYYYPSLKCSQLDALNIRNLVFDPSTGSVIDYEGQDYEFDRAHTGYICEYDLNLSGNVNNRFYWGLTVGINSVHYNGYSEYFERLNSASYPEVLISDNLKLTGYGYSIKFGGIVRPIEESAFRLGVAVSTPTFYRLETDNYTTIGTNVDSESATEKFRFNTPWKFGISAGHTIGTNVALGAVYEYSDYSTCDMRTIDGRTYDYWSDMEVENSSSEQVMKRQIENTLKGVSTLKLGAEFRPSKELALRLGYNYISPVYKENAVRDQTIPSPGVYYASSSDYTNWKDTHRLTFGLGTSIDKFRIDLAYQYQMRDGDFYPFMKQYSADYIDDATGKVVTLTNSCEPVKVKDNRHQFICTLSYTF